MIIDHLSNSVAFSVLPQWSAIKEFVERMNLDPLPAGRYDIDGDNLYAIVAEESFRDVVNPLEAHRTYLDVQMALEGSFVVLWKPLAMCVELQQEYDSERDFLLMADAADTRLVLEPGIAAVFYPEDAHAPQPPASTVKKVVFKVRL